MEPRDESAAFPTTAEAGSGPAGTTFAVRRSLLRGFAGVGAIAVTGLLVVAVTRGPVVLIALAAAVGAAMLLVALQSAGCSGPWRRSRPTTTRSWRPTIGRASTPAWTRSPVSATTGPSRRSWRARSADALRTARPVSLVIIDLDDLKRAQRHGRPRSRRPAAGHAVGRLIRATLRAADRPFRIGGDEFALLLPATEPETAFAVARRLLASATGGHPILRDIRRFSFSAGLSTCPNPSRRRGFAWHITRMRPSTGPSGTGGPTSRSSIRRATVPSATSARPRSSPRPWRTWPRSGRSGPSTSRSSRC